VISPAGRADAGAFLVRLLRLDPAALVRLRPSRDRADLTELWARLPFGALVTRGLPGAADGDTTVEAAALLRGLTGASEPAPRRRDEDWRWPLPPSRGEAVEEVPAADIARIARAASETLRTAAEHGVGGRAVGERVLRDALLDHVPIVVTDGPRRIEVSQRLVQAVVRMGFIPTGSDYPPSSKPMTSRHLTITVRLAAGWIGLDASYGSAWYRPSSPLRLS